MSAHSSTVPLPSAVSGESTTILVPTVTRIDTQLDVNPVSVVLAVSIVYILWPITVIGNSIILVAFYRYKRLRTASNCLLVSLAVSDFGVGVFMPFGMQLELSGLPENGVSTLCIVPYCIVIALCSVSVLVTVAIAVDRLTSLAQPLRYKNIITHSSIEKYIAVFWIYAIAVGLSPLIYAQVTGQTQSHSVGNCRFGAAVLPPVRVFLVVAVWAPSALVLLGCYMYVYLVARAHARAIYTVELSFRHQTQTLALPRYGQTLAVTVGAFLLLWLPFQTCMLVDIFCGTNILSEWTVVWLALPILAHSGANPWIYAFHHGEIRVAAGKIAEDLAGLFGVMPSRYGCSPTRRGSNTHMELAEVNNSNDERRHPVEDCFAAKQHSVLYPGRRGVDASGKHTDISPERNSENSSSECRQDIVEEDIHDLTKMLDPKYIIDRNRMIDSNHNIDKIRNLKYLLDPTFNKIRYLRRLNHKRLTTKNYPNKSERRFTSYQNLKTDGTMNRKILQMNTMSDPMLSADSPVVDAKDFDEALCHDGKRRNSNLSSMSDPNIKATTGHSSEVNLRLFPVTGNETAVHRYSVQNLDYNKCDAGLARQVMICRQLENQKRLVCPRLRAKLNVNLDRPGPALNLKLQNSYASLPTPDSAKSSMTDSPMQRFSPRHMTITSNRLASMEHARPPTSLDPTIRLIQARKNLEILRHSESVNTIEPMTHTRLLEPSRIMDSLVVPTIHSEPPSPIDPLPLASLQEEEQSRSSEQQSNKQQSNINGDWPMASMPSRKSPVRHSDPVIPSVLLNIEDFSDTGESRTRSVRDGSLNHLPSSHTPTIEPIDLFEALLKNSERSRESRLPEPIFAEHDSTRFSSRRPSDSKWSESSRSQEVLSNVAEHQAFPSSYSVNNFQSCNSGSDLNDLTSLDPFMCPDALTSSLRESFFSAPSVPGSDIFTSFEECEEPGFTPDVVEVDIPVYNSVSSTNLNGSLLHSDLQSKSTESVFRSRQMSTKSCAILRLEPSLHRSRLRVRPCTDYILKDLPTRKACLAPLATPTPTDICTPTFEFVSEIKSDSGVGVRV